MSQKLSKVGGWEWDTERQLMYWTEEVYHIHDIPVGAGLLAPQEAIPLSLNCYPVRERQQLGDAFNRCAKEGVPYDLQAPFTTTKGRKIWIRTTAQAVWEEGKITKVRGNVMDITEAKVAEEASRKSERTLQKIFEILPIGLWFADKTGKLLRGNPTGIRIWGGEPKVGLPEYGVFKARRLPSGEEIAPEDWALAHTIRDGVTIKDELLEIDALDGQTRIILNNTAPVIDDDGEMLGAIVVNQDVTHQKQMEMELEEERNSLAKRVEERTADLRRSTASLEKALVAKDEFLANMSHELRTPLMAILGLSELLNTESYGELSERQTKYLFTIQESGEHLLALINDILDLAKAAAGKLDIVYAEVCVEDLCQSSLAFVHPLAERKQIQISYTSEDEDLVIQSDGRRVRQILVNLLNNAVKFTPDGGHVALNVTLDEEAQEVHFSISDDGIGIAEEDMSKLFQPFTQLDSGLDRSYEGSGLGLALVHKLVDLLQGNLSLQSTGVSGEGSTFIVSLPWQIDRADRQDLSEIINQEASLDFGELIEDMNSTHCTILLVEDNQANITTISDYLEIAGYQVVVALNGRQAIEMADQYLPDLILMDIYMPVMDGLEAIRLLRSDERFADTIIFALTALAMPEDRDRCLEAGANEFLTKPIQLKALLARIKAYL
jgi:signal transduction histidine kinase